MSKTSYAEQINFAQVLSDGLSNNLEQIQKRGITPEFVAQLKVETAEAIRLNSEQEKLKADLKAKTAELDTKLAAIAKAVAEAKKVVKLEVPKERWKEFGIGDKA